eukprot:12088669-Ditylum_brightwellii.AAC.1
MELSPVSSAQRAARLLSMCLAEFSDVGAWRWSFVRLLVSEISRPFPSAAFTVCPTTSSVSVFLCGRAKMVKFVRMLGVFQVECPYASLLMLWEQSHKCSSAALVNPSGAPVCLLLLPAPKSSGGNFKMPFFDEVLPERLLAQVALRLSIKCDSVAVSTVR